MSNVQFFSAFGYIHPFSRYVKNFYKNRITNTTPRRRSFYVSRDFYKIFLIKIEKFQASCEENGRRRSARLKNQFRNFIVPLRCRVNDSRKKEKKRKENCRRHRKVPRYTPRSRSKSRGPLFLCLQCYIEKQSWRCLITSARYNILHFFFISFYIDLRSS